ncbi:SCO family protein [Henriciella litoralis]|uniref:SCO family protein n=1 Tax=Henriciella litoralis TaxID=568102 RepID=UPI001F16BC1F|nr:SCO family protein [Henriciella litoralis]
MYHNILIASALLLAACGGEQSSEGGSKAVAGGSVGSCTTRAYDEIGGPFELTADSGERMTQEDFKGRPTLVYFGFTYCPDICPGTLVGINNAYRLLPDGVEPPQTVLITVDPERDTPEALAKYVNSNAFPDNLVGLTGTPEEIKAVADEFIVAFNRVETPDSVAGYTMDHTSLIYLMDKDWKLKTFFAETNANPEDMSRCLAQLIG